MLQDITQYAEQYAYATGKEVPSKITKDDQEITIYIGSEVIYTNGIEFTGLMLASNEKFRTSQPPTAI